MSNSAQQIIELFNSVRDIPYQVPLSLEEENFSCVGKGILLKNKLETAGYTVRWKEGEFRWEDVGLPAYVLAVAHDALSTHVWLEVLIDDQWIVADPTWDKDLKVIFSVNEWDGKSSQHVAFPVIRTIPDEDVVITAEPPPEWEQDIKRNKDFFEAVNNWLDEQRKKKLK